MNKIFILLLGFFVAMVLGFGCDQTDSGDGSSDGDGDADGDSDSDSDTDSDSDGDADSDADSGASCESCHKTPPDESPHSISDHNRFSCNNENCHGEMINEDGTEVLDSALHQNGTTDATCGRNNPGCH